VLHIDLRPPSVTSFTALNRIASDRLSLVLCLPRHAVALRRLTSASPWLLLES